MFGIKGLWSNQTVAVKIYMAVGAMVFLIAVELLALKLAMSSHSAVRAFVAGEGHWSKSQKSAVLNLQNYIWTRNPLYYDEFNLSLGVIEGNRAARIEILKPEYNHDVVRQGFIKGGIHPADIDNMVLTVRGLSWSKPIKEALKAWEQGDFLIDELVTEAMSINFLIRSGANPDQLLEFSNRIEKLDRELTQLEHRFSTVLSEASRQAEIISFRSILLLILVVEGVGLYLVVFVGRNLTQRLKRLTKATHQLREGDFNVRLRDKYSDEVGDLALAVDQLAEKLSVSLGERQQAQSASEQKSLFLAHVSHELRTPLGAIIGFSDLLSTPGLKVEENDKYVKIISRASRNMLALLNDILDFSKIEAGKLEIEESSVSLEKLIQDTIGVVQVKCAAKSIELIVKQVGHVPPQISTDPLRLQQILMNLLSNAIKFTSHGTILLDYGMKDGKIEITVSDTGIGIPVEDVPRLFKSYSQGHRSISHNEGGCGLGLALSKRLAALLGGDLELVRTKVGEGSVFRFRFKPKVVATERKWHRPESKTLNLDFSGVRVLVVEDLEENQLLIQSILKRRGIDVSLASNGKQACELALNEKFDLILMDLQMPIMNGTDAVRFLREHNYKRPVIALTAHAFPSDRKMCLEAGYDDFLTKPILIPRLMEILDQFLNKSRTLKDE